MGEGVGDAMHAAAVTVLLSAALLALLLSLPLAFQLVAALRRPDQQLREAFYDRCIQLAVAISFVLYPVLCGRLLLLFHLSDFGAARVLSSDVRPLTPLDLPSISRVSSHISSDVRPHPR